MSSDQSYIDQIANTLVTQATEDDSTPYVIMVFPDGILFTSTGGVHEGLMESVLSEYDDSDGAWSDLDGAFCMLIRTEKTEDAATEIRECLIENDFEEHQIHEDDLSTDYDSIDDYISDTRTSDGLEEEEEEEFDEHDPSNWDDSEDEDDESDWDDDDENY